ncbi:hypothetical protein OF377_01390 [Ureaplasma sp. ES3154-GEN]|uniref:hypothetical protein n=1 Tax=Ureaplasma sp. ES3154-GEN TaxID=2984844 RepID=UPI0021E9419C|nr:hypothetical protein [Ureaplasma sp. ES3154-GEN]MCV3743541.1 hypothetical protein [Ureaplasma sp. ES3154-GEN]
MDKAIQQYFSDIKNDKFFDLNKVLSIPLDVKIYVINGGKNIGKTYQIENHTKSLDSEV